MKFPQILHCDNDGSDKVYIVEVDQLGSNYVVTTTHGPRTAQVLSSRIIYNGGDKLDANYKAEKVVNEKLKKKYKSYSGKIAGYNRKVSEILLNKTDTKDEIMNSAAKARKITL